MSEFIEFRGYTLEFLSEKALWIKELQSVFLADLHLGKASHFRKAGIPIPEPIHEADFKNLKNLFQRVKPNKIFFLGDLFHSHWNTQWAELNTFLSGFPDSEFHLVKGNHDILPSAIYAQSLLNIHEKPMVTGPFTFSHEPLEQPAGDSLNVCGHIHPGIVLRGKARQTVKTPCFFWTGNTLILPSFGNFTGLALVQVKEEDKVWIISGQKVIPILSRSSIG
jgi:DNA ligase-associated metallophosphoesterase